MLSESSVRRQVFMKIAIVGTGALGGYYGALLARAGNDVTFLLRSDYEVVSDRGFKILSPNGDFTLKVNTAREPGEIGLVDLVVIGLKTRANSRFAELLTPLVREDTMVLTLQNGLGSDARLAELFTPDQVLGGLCFVCINRPEPGVIRHLAYGRIVMGEYAGPPTERTMQLAAAFRDAGIPCEVAENLRKAQWEKLVWNIPFNGLGVASAAGYKSVVAGHVDPDAWVEPCLNTEELLADDRWAKLVKQLMLEVIGAAKAQGIAIGKELADKMIANTRKMGAYRASTVIDYQRGLPIELENIFLEPLRQAEKAGAPVPLLARICRVITQLNHQQ